jgi:hypothetical protein
MSEGLITLRQNGWKAVVQGITTPEEVLNVTVKDAASAVVEQDEPSENSSAKVTVSVKEEKPLKSKKKISSQAKGDYDSRSFARTFEPVEIRYRLTKEDSGQAHGVSAFGAEYSTLTEDLSAGGLRFIAKTLLSVGTILEVKISLGTQHRAVVCFGKVCRVEEDSLENVYTIVVSFFEISDEDRARITAFVDEKVKTDQKPPASSNEILKET